MKTKSKLLDILLSALVISISFAAAIGLISLINWLWRIGSIVIPLVFSYILEAMK